MDQDESRQMSLPWLAGEGETAVSPPAAPASTRQRRRQKRKARTSALRPGHAVLYQFNLEKIKPAAALEQSLEQFRRRYGEPTLVLAHPDYELPDLPELTIARHSWISPGTLQIA